MNHSLPGLSHSCDGGDIWRFSVNVPTNRRLSGASHQSVVFIRCSRSLVSGAGHLVSRHCGAVRPSLGSSFQSRNRHKLIARSGLYAKVLHQSWSGHRPVGRRRRRYFSPSGRATRPSPWADRRFDVKRSPTKLRSIRAETVSENTLGRF